MNFGRPVLGTLPPVFPQWFISVANQFHEVQK
jgi:hypothetical protein